jgi:hypothetical protein
MTGKTDPKTHTKTDTKTEHHDPKTDPAGNTKTDPTGDQLDALYTERAHLVALAAKDYPSAYTDDPENDGWIIVYVDLPTGQASWYITPSDQHLFAHVRFAPDTEYDGHTTEEKYGRIRAHISGEQA